jgi:ADAM-TS Spacer 1/ADAM cysteine-rich domain
MIVPFGDSAADGTPCNIGTNDMCIDGICRKVGCDWAVDSQMKEDQCGVCGGDGKTCTTIQGEFTEKLDMADGFHQILIIPEGSRNIVVEEMDASKNYIGIGKANSEDFYLNGNSMIFMSGEYEIAGTMGLYERIEDLEKLKIPGPIKHNISLNVSEKLEVEIDLKS